MATQDSTTRLGWEGERTATAQALFLLGQAVSVIEGLVESPTDAIDIKMAQEFLADYRRWLEASS